MRAFLSLFLVLVLASFGLATCGDGDDGGDEAVDTASPRSGALDLNWFSMRKGEASGA